MFKNTSRIIAGIGSSIVIMGLLFYFFLFLNPMAIYDVNTLKWIPIFICIVALWVSGRINRNTPIKLLTFLFLPFVIFHLFNFIYFPFILTLILVGILTLISTRIHQNKRYRRLSMAGITVIFLYYLFSQALILKKESFAYDDAGELVNVNVIWDFRDEKKNLQLENHILLDGNEDEVNMIEFRDKIHFVTIWATWCAPCIKEKPLLDKLKLKLQHNPNIVFIDISFDNDKSKWRKFIKANEPMGMQLISRNSRETSRKLNFAGIPMHLIVDRDGSYKKYKSFNVAQKVLLNSIEIR